MEQYLNAPVKEVITKFPKIGKILEEYEIGCVPCSVGSCLLKDVVDIHNLPDEEVNELMARISQEIYPGQKVEIPRSNRTRKARSRELTYSPPMKRLVDEHVLIKRWIALIPHVLETFDLHSSEDRQIITDGVYFIRSYADRFHHAKEEDILFKYYDETSDIIKTMLDDHVEGRGHAKATLEALEKKDRRGVVDHLMAYRELLTEHIKKEDEILYPWMDRELSVKHVGELFSKFNDADDGADHEGIKRCEKFVLEVEKKFRKEDAT
jgi:hemerythrin-like domain-containing protein